MTKLEALAKKLLSTKPDTTASRCSPECYSSRAIIRMGSAPRPTVLDAWAEAVREESGEPFDWHYVGGHAVFRSPGNYQKLYTTIESLLPALQWAYVVGQEREGSASGIWELGYSWCAS